MHKISRLSLVSFFVIFLMLPIPMKHLDKAAVLSVQMNRPPEVEL